MYTQHSPLEILIRNSTEKNELQYLEMGALELFFKIHKWFKWVKLSR